MTPIINALMCLVVATILPAGSDQVGSGATTPIVINPELYQILRREPKS